MRQFRGTFVDYKGRSIWATQNALGEDQVESRRYWMSQDENKPTNNVARRGFAALDAEQRRRIASMGGRAAHEKGTAHEFTSEEAAAAGRKRGQGSRRNSRQESETASVPQAKAYASL